ncbi:hypothetical protein A2480_01295 [Candidatus Uhrbacteria bacterium RIFOXYC2_FULL_47_19]|uniref:ASCH domain-containing protein n=1 Tax=Candidatus Uhrbacteria bacterium RIFOXYC2_FULL_47_19 TaxID=1802424 RepID=A0A1F7WE32_9BACT|nr:MAG: hypothetical protein A2480_01295 [Candidatus Uhrbacteria bacterium RIFOXYC2_FULL_47_19]HCC22416.1 hypothetical protein [Candidatus Uhrbacteria bacterium]
MDNKKISVHGMKLHPYPFDRIKSGQKIDELRLNDEKRKLIKIGDQIEFSRRPDLKEKLIVKVISLNTYPNFVDLYEGVKKRYPTSDKDNFIEGLRQYYSPEDEVKFGALEIGIRLV